MKRQGRWEQTKNSLLARTLETYGVNMEKLPMGAAIQFAEGGIIVDAFLEVEDIPIIAAEDLVIIKKFYPHPETPAPPAPAGSGK